MSRPSRPTAADVARKAGVDRSTVSRILSRAFDHHRYALKTIRQVERAARELQYRPSVTARSLRTGRSMVIGLIAGDISNSFFGQLAAEIEPRLRAHQYRLMIGSTYEDTQAQDEHFEDMLLHGVDGIIISPTTSHRMKTLTPEQTPVVLIDRPLSRSALPYVGIDNHNAGRLIGEHLRQAGYRRVGVVMPHVRSDPTLRWRLQGLKAGLANARSIIWSQTLPLRADKSARRDVIARLSRSPDSVQVIVGLTNDCTITALEAIRELGLSVPDQIGLAGIDDFRAAKLLNPPLTVVAQPIEAIAEKAVEYLLSALSGKPKTEDCLLPPQLIVRQSLHSNASYQENL